MVAWVYTRVSTLEQALDGFSLPAQDRSCRSFCSRMEWDLGTASNFDNPGVFCDPGVSAWKIPLFERPGWQHLWRNVKPQDKIVFYSIDRGFRSVQDFANTMSAFRDAKVAPVFVQEDVDLSTATGKLVGHVVAAFAQYMSDMWSESRRERNRLIREAKAATPGPMPKLKQKFLENRIRSGSSASVKAVVSRLGAHDHREVKRILSYARVSTSKQDTAAQRRSLRGIRDRAIERYGAQRGGMFVDHGVSAYCVNWDERPAGRQMFEQLQPGDMIVITRVDRAFRSVQDMACRLKEFDKRGVWLKTGCGLDTTTEAGRQAIEILSLLAEWDSRIKSRRQRMGIRLAVEKRGPWIRKHKIPWFISVKHDSDGWSLFISDEHARLCRKAMRWKRRYCVGAGGPGSFGLRSLADMLNDYEASDFKWTYKKVRTLERHWRSGAVQELLRQRLTSRYERASEVLELLQQAHTTHQTGAQPL